MKTITKEIVLPDWVNWIAQDDNGEWYGYECQPISKQNTLASEDYFRKDVKSCRRIPLGRYAKANLTPTGGRHWNT